MEHPMVTVFNACLCVVFCRYMTAGCKALILILRNFAQVIKTNIEAPIQTLGTDIQREERLDTFVFVLELLMSRTSEQECKKLIFATCHISKFELHIFHNKCQ
jgi:hypothetical protein